MSSASVSKLRFLVVDDEPTAAVLLGGMLMTYGAVEMVSDARSASARATGAITEDRGFDVIFLDAELQDGHGLDVLKSLRDAEHAKGLRPGRGSTPVVFVTASGDPRLFMKIFREQADAFLRKPIDAESVLDVLQRVLTGKVPSAA